MTSMTVDQVIRELMIQLGESTENKYPRMLQSTINGLREFNFDLNPDQGALTVVSLNVNSNATVDLPLNYLDYSKIGITDSLGNFVSMGYNQNLRYSNPLDSCGNPILPLPTVASTADANDILLGAFWNWDGFADNYRNGEPTGRFFGLGGGNSPNGYYRVSQQTGQILLGGVAAGQIVLEYLADLTLIDGEYQIHPYAVSALKRFIYYDMIEMNPRIAEATKERARVEKFNEFRRAKARFNAVRLDEFQAMFRRENKATPRF